MLFGLQEATRKITSHRRKFNCEIREVLFLGWKLINYLNSRRTFDALNFSLAQRISIIF